ncbi:hypothetical protein BHM03_00030272, partial [Ensete ventricosum]
MRYCCIFAAKAASNEGGWPRLGPCKGDQPRPCHPQGGNRQWPGPTRKGGRRCPQRVVDASSLQAITRRGSSPHGWRLRAKAPPAREAANRGSARSRLVHRGVAPVEVTSTGAKPAVGAIAPWQGGCQRARQPSPAQGRRRHKGGKGVK